MSLTAQLTPEIQKEYERAIERFPSLDVSVGPRCLTVHEVLRAHYLIANHFYLVGEGLGGIGPKDVGLLESAVFRQTAQFAGVVKWDSLFDVCATLFFGLIKNHPFYDANKRTAFLAALFQLYQAGMCPATPEKVFEDLTVEVAEGALGKYARFRDLKDSGEVDPEIKFVAWFLRKNSRQIDNASYSVTYNELDTLLNRFNFGLADPKGNHIQIVRYEDRREFFGLGKKVRIATRIGQVGFPRWTTQVSKNDVRHVREVTRLTAKDGVDSAAFFKGLDPMKSLIASYNEPLLRLAQR
jgi:death-on-curing protein